MHCITPILRQRAKRVAIVIDGERITYRTLQRDIARVAHVLQQAHYKTIALDMPNSYDWLRTFLGAVAAGVTPYLLDSKWSMHEKQQILLHHQPDCVITEKLPLCDNDTYELRQAPSLFVGFTSGTTGIPKGYERTHLSWIESFRVTAEAFRLEQTRHYCAPGPLVHSMTLFAAMQALVEGKTIHLQRKFDAMGVMTLCQTYDDMALFVVPTMLEALTTTDSCATIHALISSGAKWQDDSKERVAKTFPNTAQYEFFGSSEASYISYSDGTKPQTVGRFFSTVQYTIRDEAFHEVSEGFLYIKSPMIFSGYARNKQATNAVFRNGWLAVGDIVTVDEEGYLTIKGRAKNRIISGGLNIFPEEVEQLLAAHPAIQEVMVCGQQDDYWGEKVVALIQWQKEPLTHEELAAYCAPFLARYKFPRDIFTVKTFYYTGSGKIARQKMKEEWLCQTSSLSGQNAPQSDALLDSSKR